MSSWQGSYGTFQVPTWIKNDLSPFEYFRKKKYIYIYWQHLFEKLGETEIIAFLFVNTIQRPCILRAISTIQVNGAQQHFFIRMTNLHLATLWSILPTKPMVWLVYFLSVLFQRWTYLLASEDSEKACKLPCCCSNQILPKLHCLCLIWAVLIEHVPFLRLFVPNDRVFV